MLGLSNKNFKAAIPLVFKYIKDNMFTVNWKIENIVREIEYIIKNQMEILELWFQRGLSPPFVDTKI